MNIPRYLPAALLSLLLAGCTTASQATAALPDSMVPDTVTAAQTAQVRIAMATDLHYQPDISDAASSLVPQMKYIEPLTDCLLDEAGAWQPDVLLLCGDLTNNGHKQEHQALVQKLDTAQKQGTRILVLPGNHDLKNITTEEFAALYQDYGYASPLMQDSASLSYAAMVTDELWVLMLDTNLPDNKDGIREVTLNWVEQVLTKADDAGAQMVTASHHTLLGHSSSQYNKQYSFENGDALLKLLKKHHVPLNISGHLHKQHAARETSHQQDFYEITGGMLAAYPNLYSQFTITPSSRRIIYQAQPLSVDEWAHSNGYQEKELLHFSDYSRQCRQISGAGLVGGMLSSMDITGEELSTLTKFWTNIYMDSSDGTIWDTRKDYLTADEYHLWQLHQNDSKYSEWLDFLLGRKGTVNSHSLLIEYVE